MRYYSEFGEDQWLWENGHLGGDGVYVDIGAGDPVTGSNTALLRDIGWTGLAVDGNHAHAPKWKTPFVCAVISNQPEVPYFVHENDPLSRVEEGHPLVPAFTLDYLLNAHNIKEIDLMSLDIEGHEFEALASMNLKLHRPRIIISEFNTLGLPEDYRVRDYLLENGYSEVHKTFANIIYFS